MCTGFESFFSGIVMAFWEAEDRWITSPGSEIKEKTKDWGRSSVQRPRGPFPKSLKEKQVLKKIILGCLLHFLNNFSTGVKAGRHRGGDESDNALCHRHPPVVGQEGGVSASASHARGAALTSGSR